VNAPLLEVRNLHTRFATKRGTVTAVSGVSFTLERGQTIGLVGESGSGKSVTALSIVQLLQKPAGQITAGEIMLDGEDLLKKSQPEMRKVRGRRIAMILQDPMSSLNPLLTVGEQIAESIRQHQSLDKASLRARVREALSLMHIPAPEVRMKQYPHQMSGGMRQRIVGAIALSCRPELLIADEPTTSLDVTIQAQFLQLLRRLRSDIGLSMILITHDLTVVAAICDRVAVMYAGRLIETATTRQIFESPKHPYTIGLLRSIPDMEKREERLESIPGQPPDLRSLGPGCPFAPRCSSVMNICREKYPPTKVFADDHSVDCWLHVDARP
jgi:oligopeptide/dipeptide ABC transporter ATP-binding protein